MPEPRCQATLGYYSVGSRQLSPHLMQNRNLLIMTLLAAFAASIGLVLFGDNSHATELAPMPLGDGPEESAPELTDPPAIPAVANGPGVPIAAVMARRDRINTTNWSAGIIRGDIRLATSVLDRLDSISVTVTELRQALDHVGTYKAPFKKTVPVERDLGTPTFEIRDIPFSDHPYAVTVYSPGLNGSRRTLSITKENALHDDVILSITPGRPFSVLVRDQDARPYSQVEVRLIAVGEPLGRKDHIGTTDSYGSAVFEHVLAGDYRIVTGHRGATLTEPEIVTVQSEARVYGNKIQGQGYTVKVRRGMPVQILISDRAGYGIAGATVKLLATDRVKLTVLDAVSDFNGKVEYAHVTPGKWTVQITKQNHTPFTKQITVIDGKLPDIVKAPLRRVR